MIGIVYYPVHFQSKVDSPKPNIIFCPSNSYRDNLSILSTENIFFCLLPARLTIYPFSNVMLNNVMLRWCSVFVE